MNVLLPRDKTLPLTLSDAVDEIKERHKNDSSRLQSLAEYAVQELDHFGLPGAIGGASELTVRGWGRDKDWDVAYNFAGKDRLLISLKSLWKNASGTVPNRIDDLMGESANVQQMSPEIVIGYILLFDKKCDKPRRPKKGDQKMMWSQYFEQRVKIIAQRRAPLWNQGMIEGCWFVLIDSAQPPARRIVDPEKAAIEGATFFRALLSELRLREPAIPFRSEV
jgi:hypothetical protein